MKTYYHLTRLRSITGGFGLLILPPNLFAHAADDRRCLCTDDESLDFLFSNSLRTTFTAQTNDTTQLLLKYQSNLQHGNLSCLTNLPNLQSDNDCCLLGSRAYVLYWTFIYLFTHFTKKERNLHMVSSILEIAATISSHTTAFFLTWHWRAMQHWLV